MRMRRLMSVAMLAAFALPVSARAQGGGAGAPGGPAGRQRMEKQLQQQIWRIAKQRVQLSDEQMIRLEATAPKFDARRRALVEQERTYRQSLRRELTAGDSANQDRVATALDRLQQSQRERADLMADEQRELATFMSPVQRARFLALQEQLRRRANALRARRAAAPAP